jgi:NAD(P)H dehydrogenase (quinone)
MKTKLQEKIPNRTEPSTMAHWLSEQVFDWSDVPTVHLRVTFFAEWLLYIAHLIREGRYVVPFDVESRVAPMPAIDIARVVVGVLENPAKHAGSAYQLHGPVEYNHKEIAEVLSNTLKRKVNFEQVTVPEFLKLLGIEHDTTRNGSTRRTATNDMTTSIGLKSSNRLPNP